MKLLPVLVSAIVPPPALIALVPVTLRAPAWLIAPLLLVALRLPVTVPLPRFNAPWLIAVSAPVLSVPRVSASTSVICAAPPVRLTAPVKLLPVLVSAIVPVPALIALVPVTSSAPAWLIAPLLLVASRLPVTVPLPRFNAPWLTAVSAPVLKVPRVSAFWSVICVAPPVRFTAPMKLLPALVSTIVPVPVSIALVPVTLRAPAWLIAPLLLVASRLPVTVPLPRFNAPWLTAVSAPVLKVPRVSAFWSVICVAPPVRFTAPMKSLPAPVSAMAPVPAATVLAPAAVTLPAIWVTAAFVLASVSVPSADTSPPSTTPLWPVRLTLVPLKAPLVDKTPPLAARTRLPVPAAIPASGRFSAPPAVRLTLPFALSVSEVTSRSLTSTSDTPAPVAATAPWKSLLACVSASTPLPALMTLVPVTVSAPAWLTAPLLLVASRLPVTVPLPRFNAPWLTTVSAPVLSVPRVSAFWSVICAAAPVRLTAPVKLLPVLVSAIAFAPALKFDTPPTVNAPVCVMPPVEVVTDRPPAPMVNASALKLPLLVLRRVSAFVPPTTPPKLARPLVFTVRLCAPLTVPPKSIAPPPVLFSVASLASVTASL